MNSIEEKVKQIVADELGHTHYSEINLTDTFEDLDCDSLDKVNVLMNVEKEFDFLISDEYAETIFTVQDLVDCVNKKIIP